MTRLVLLCLGVAACANATDDDVINPDEPRALVVVPGESKVAVGAALDHDGVTDEGVADLRVRAGTLAHFDGVVDELTLSLHDVPLPAVIYPGDIVLTDLEVTLPEPCATPCIADLALTWNAWIGGELHPLEPQLLPGFALDVSGDDVSIHRDGEFWSYLGVARLSNAAASLRVVDDIIP